MVKPKKQSKVLSKAKFSKIVIFLFIISGIIFLVDIMIFFDFFILHDDKRIEFKRNYLIFLFDEKSGSPNIPNIGDTFDFRMISTNNYLDGLIELKTISRSTQLPIDVDIKLQFKTNSSVPVIVNDKIWKAMPQELHFEFENAYLYPETYDENGKLKSAEIIVKQNSKKMQYDGSDTIFYEDDGKYSFYLKESQNFLQLNEEGVDVLPFDISNYNDQVIVYEIKNDDEKIEIKSYDQTSTVFYGKNGLVVALSIVGFTLIGIPIAIMKKQK